MVKFVVEDDVLVARVAPGTCECIVFRSKASPMLRWFSFRVRAGETVSNVLDLGDEWIDPFADWEGSL